MPLEKIRILSLLILGASITAYLSGDFGLGFFLIQISIILPLWFPIDLDAVRAKSIWKYYGLVTFGIFIACLALRVHMRTSVFFLVLFCLVYELYGEKRKRAPVRIVGLLSFLIVIHQARIHSGLNLFFGVFIYIFSVIVCLSAFYLGPLYRFDLVHLLRKKMAPLLAHVFWIILLGFWVFWMLPRFPQQSLSAIPSLIGDRISGFSDRVTLTDIGSLKLSRKHVMDLKSLNGVLHSRYLKGKILDYYDRGVWSSSSFFNDYPSRDEENRYRFTRTPETATYTYRVDLEAIHGNTVFFFDNLVALKGIPHQLQASAALTHLSVARPFPLAFSYYLYAADEPGSFRQGLYLKSYLQMPRGHDYFEDIAEQILREEASAAVPRKVDRLLAYFQTFRYTLDIYNQGVGDPLREFMIRRKEGHCELFASAMVMLLRSQGIPARLVTGFLVPEAHPSGDFYYITESDAHAWVEYLYNGVWHTIDPTPPAQFSTPHFGEAQLARLKRFWRTMVLTWDFDSQKEYMTKLRGALGNALQLVQNRPSSLWLPVLLMLIPLYLLKLRPWLVRNEDRLARCFRRLDRLLQRQYGTRSHRKGIFDYVSAIEIEPRVRAELLAFLRAYHRYRFGNPDKPGTDPLTLLQRGKSVMKQLKHRAREGARR